MEEYTIIADISATHSTFALLQITTINNKKISKNILQQQYATNNYKTFEDLLNRFTEQIIKEFQITPQYAIFAVAGRIEDNKKEGIKVNMTNTSLTINTKELQKITKIKHIEIMNDFTAIAYGIKSLTKFQLKTINNKSFKITGNKPILVVGAGTDFGVSHLIYNKETKRYEPQPSEAGSEDFPIQNEEELKMCNFIKQKRGIKQVRIGNFLSGKGIEDIYEYLSKEQLVAKKISSLYNQKTDDEYAKKTFEIFYKLYARVIKNLALDALCENGIYLAGGIITKNLNFSKKEFMNEFTNSTKFSKFLSNIPIHIIKDYNVSIQGLENYLMINKQSKKIIIG